MTAKSAVVFLFDVDNTLLDNDRITTDLRSHLEREVGRERQERYWAIFEELRAGLGYADYLGALQRYRVEYPRDPHVLMVSTFLLDYPFASRLYPGALDVLARCRAWAPTVILSDGDAVFQPRKVKVSGLEHAVEHYVAVDDKLRILTAFKQTWGSRVTTVFPRQGHYAHDPTALARTPGLT